ncbi:hypothetical protein K438DRAFT_452918 [Mycena galopus ATCC 62051]|nr:hypothetical protein K438DRAFT_452918 [Mycena galopus ATCC 62051]
MQFSLVALLAALATGALAAPAPLFLRQSTCDISTCVLDLAPSVVSCGSAVAQVDLDPVSDISCLIAATQDAVQLPASCSGCLVKFGIGSSTPPPRPLPALALESLATLRADCRLSEAISPASSELSECKKNATSNATLLYFIVYKGIQGVIIMAE